MINQRGDEEEEEEEGVIRELSKYRLKLVNLLVIFKNTVFDLFIRLISC